MSGQPAARITDRVAQGRIITGSRTVLIGSQGGIACSVCPGGLTIANPVNPQLGAKVLLGPQDLDFALPSAALPLVWQRQYSSYVNPQHGAACGLLGHGWHLPQELAIELLGDSTLLHDASGRVITFAQALVPGGQLHSASEDLWLLRGGNDRGDHDTAAWAAHPRWAPFAQQDPALARSPRTLLAASGPGGGQGDILWCFAPGTGQAQEGAGAWQLVARIDRFGRRQSYHYSDGTQRGPGQPGSPESAPLPAGRLPAGRLIALTDGAGRRYRLLHQRIHGGRPAQGLWGADDGWRLIGVDLEHDRLAPSPLSGHQPSPIPLVRYGYGSAGELITVHDRAGQRVRAFEWEHHRIRAHRHRSGPWHRYRYDSAQPGARVIAHSSEDGLSYRFEYLAQPPGPHGQPRTATRVSDSLDRTETYHFEGEAGLSRLIAHHKADASRWLYSHDSFGRLASHTDPLGRCTHLRRDGQGRLLGLQRPDGRSTSLRYDDTTGQLIEASDAAGATTAYRYDAWGRLAAITGPDGGTQTYHYPDPQDTGLACDSPIRIEDAQGGSQHLAWSDAGQLLSHTDCSGQDTRYRYDRWGALSEVINALGQCQRHHRDAQGRIVASEWNDGQIERYHYDEAGHLMRIEPAPPGQGPSADTSIHLRHDLWGRLTERRHGGLTLAFEYDAAGRLTRLVNENNAQSRFAWDALDRLVQEEGFDLRLQRYHWDEAGQLIEATDGNAARQTSSHYRWDANGQLTERRLAASAHASAQTHGYTWDAAGRLSEARVWVHTDPDTAGGGPLLQSRIQLQRDRLGRITGEVQQLYRPQPPASALQDPPLEYEHRIRHGLDRLGQRRHSTLQGLGRLDWLTYGAGHVHGLLHDGQPLLDIERDALHRETLRSLHLRKLHDNQPAAPLQTRREWDRLGRLAAIATQGLQDRDSAAAGLRPLLGQITGRRYHYDALGQLAAIEQITAPGQALQQLRYGYDSAGRLRAAADSLQPQARTRWPMDPAGNRLPGDGTTGPGQSPDHWAAQVHAHWRQADFNLLGLGHMVPPQHGPVQRWPDNRIGFTQERAWRYDACGNRITQLQSDQGRQDLHYDGAHQLIAVQLSRGSAGGEPGQALHHCHYLYDALGRRLRKQNHQPGHPSRTCYYGWDGDRLVHTERVQEGQDTRQLEHTVYEPGGFTPLLRLSTSRQGDPLDTPHLLVRAIGASLPDTGDGNHEQAQALAAMQSMLRAMPRFMQEDLERHTRQALEQGLPPQALAILGDQAESARQIHQTMQENLQAKERREQAPIAIHHYLCDHLGTPLALMDQAGHVVWAARLDPWGQVQEEYNPQGIHQEIRLPGQHHDRETGLYYNRHRYYDPEIGAYINQDPIGLRGGC